MKVVRKITNGIRLIRLFKNWVYLLLSYYGLSRNTDVVHVLRNGLRFKVASPRGGFSAIASMWLDRIWTPFGDEIQPGCTVIDIGAHIGAFSIFAATRVPGVRVIGYEPCARNFEVLVENVKLNGLKNIEVFPLGVAEDSEKRQLFISHNDLSHSLVKPQVGTGHETYEDVDCITLKEVLEQVDKCDFLKINCEGAEYEILFNTPQEYLSKVGRMSIDCHENLTYNGYLLESYLEKVGFKVILVKSPTGSHTYLYAMSKSQNKTKDASTWKNQKRRHS